MHFILKIELKFNQNKCSNRSIIPVRAFQFFNVRHYARNPLFVSSKIFSLTALANAPFGKSEVSPPNRRVTSATPLTVIEFAPSV